MSVDAAAAVAAANADLAALIQAELDQLAADAQALRGILLQGVVATARVLPSNGLTDLVEIAGRRVAAALPATVRPGDVLQVQVTAFEGDRILLQVVGTGADVAVETTPLRLPPELDPGLYIPTPPQSASAAPPAPPASRTVTVMPPSPAAPPPGAAPPPAPPPSAAAGGPGPAFTSVVARANVAQVNAPPPNAPRVARAAPLASPRPPIVVPLEPTSIEARVAAARTTVGAGLAEAPAPALPRTFVAPPPIAPKLEAPPPAAAPPAAAGVNRPAPVRGPSAYAEPVALLRALRLPVTPANVASATLALQRPEQLPVALSALERALPRASADPNVATLRTLLAFVGRIDPRSPVLATQIAAYVDHVVDGAEPKLATLLAASQAAVVHPEADAPPPSRSLPPDPPPPIPQAVSAERATALSADLKQTVLALAADPGTAPGAAPALAGALSALSAVQITAAQTLAAHPDGVTFSIPLATPNGTSNAQISIKRDAPGARGVPLDPANFRIAFVLETAHYGTVAIDLVTVGRDVTVDVRTESAPAMRAFRDALGALTARLEALHYRVASSGAVLAPATTISLESAAAPQLADPEATVDRSA